MPRQGKWGYVDTRFALPAGDIYRGKDIATGDEPRRFETEPMLLRDVTIIVKGSNQLFGDESTQDYPVNAGGAFGYQFLDVATLWFKNATSGQNGTVHILAAMEN